MTKIKVFKNDAMAMMETCGIGYRVFCRNQSGEILDRVICDDYRGLRILSRFPSCRQKQLIMRFYQLPINATFQTQPVEITGGFAVRTFTKTSKTRAIESGVSVKFHALTPVFAA